jgi:hypothetical protein
MVERKRTKPMEDRRDNLPLLTVTPEEFPLVFRGVSRTRLYEAIKQRFRAGDASAFGTKRTSRVQKSSTK